MLDLQRWEEMDLAGVSLDVYAVLIRHRLS
jgi:hypothetical protein